MADFREEVEDKIQFAVNLYADRNGDQDNVMEVLQAEFDIDRDIQDSKLTLVNVPTAQAIVKLFQSYLAIGLDIATQVLPHDESDEEQELCTKLEKYLAAVRAASEYDAHRAAYQNFTWWFLARGWGVFKTLFYPEYVDSYYFPIRILDRDPHNVYPLFGDTGPLYVVEKYDRYVGDLKRELDALLDKKREKDVLVWKRPDLKEYADTEQVEVTEYWDEKFKGLRVAGDWVWLRPHLYQIGDQPGIIPYSFAFCEKMPLSDGKWMGRSIIAPIMDIIKQQSVLMSKVATATEIFYYPQILVKTPHGESFVMSSAPGQVRNVPPGSEVQVLNPQPNQMMLDRLMVWLEKSVSLFGLPDVLWGVQPGQVQAGYAITALQAGAKTKISQKAGEIETAVVRTHEHVLRLTEIFAPLAKGGFEIYPVDEVAKGTRAGPPLQVTADDVAGHYKTRVKITPDLPQDQLMQWKVAQMAREPSKVTNLPVASDAYVREEIIKLKHPDVEEERLLDEFLSTHPDIQKAKAALFVHQWMRDHKPELEKMVKELEKEAEKERKKVEKEREKEREKMETGEALDEAMIQRVYQEALAQGLVPPELQPVGAPPSGMPPPGMLPGAPPMGPGAPPGGTGLPPEMMPPSLMGAGPGPAPTEGVDERIVEQMMRQGPPRRR